MLNAHVTLWTIRAEYDPETKVWWSADSDIPDLAVEAESLELVAAKTGTMLPDLLKIHADDIVDKTRLVGPHRIRIIACYEHQFDVAG